MKVPNAEKTGGGGGVLSAYCLLGAHILWTAPEDCKLPSCR